MAPKNRIFRRHRVLQQQVPLTKKILVTAKIDDCIVSDL
jgi:hypothetical protein